MTEFEGRIGSGKITERPETRDVSDAGRARGTYSIFNRTGEIGEEGGLFNALDGTHPHTQEDVDTADRGYLAQHPAIKGQQSLASRVARVVRSAVHKS